MTSSISSKNDAIGTFLANVITGWYNGFYTLDSDFAILDYMPLQTQFDDVKLRAEIIVGEAVEYFNRIDVLGEAKINQHFAAMAHQLGIENIGCCYLDHLFKLVLDILKEMLFGFKPRCLKDVEKQTIGHWNSHRDAFLLLCQQQAEICQSQGHIHASKKPRFKVSMSFVERKEEKKQA